jgi:hypothetical protein
MVVTDILTFIASSLAAFRRLRTCRVRKSRVSMMQNLRTWLSFLLRRSALYVQGLIRFGPARTHRGGNAVRIALAAFENQYGRLPDDAERRRLVQKLAWFDQHHQRVPTPEEVVQMVQQLELH